MAPLQKLQQLSSAHCVLLAAHYATESNITALRALTALRDADLPLELTLELLLTYLPEELEPLSYTEYLLELATDSRDPGPDPAAALDVSPVEQLSISRAKKRRKDLDLVPVVNHTYASDKELDIFSHFLLQRAHRIDAQTGLLDLIPQLVVPFLSHSEYLRTWFISTALPLLRLSYEYYPQNSTASLDEFAQLRGRRAIDYQLSNVQHSSGQDVNNITRDLKGVVAPWMCGANDRKRRRVSGHEHHASIAQEQSEEPHDWVSLFEWMLHTSKENLPLVAAAINGWDGPEDMDLGGFEEGRDYVPDAQQRQLEMHYAQTAIAALYLIENSDFETIQTAHSLLRRICDLLSYDLPPDLGIGVESLPSNDPDDHLLQDSTVALLREDRLLDPGNAVTRPSKGSVQVLKLVVFSAVVLSNLQQPLSIRELAKFSLRDDEAEQVGLLTKVLHTLCSSKRDSEQWTTTRLKLLWLWNWGTDNHDDDRQAQGIFGMLGRKEIETEILKTFIENSHYDLVVQTYINPANARLPLPLEDVEKIALNCALNHYDNASNGNRTRGGMKRVYDILGAFTPHFPQSSRFQRAQALLKATHAMSYYSLVLQHGVPFQPVNIRVSSKPLSLIRKLLSQNPGSYTKLDDLIAIGQNLVVSSPSTLTNDDETSAPLDASIIERKKAATERRVIGMAIEAALEENDFETAYSYVVTRLTLSTPFPTPISSQDFSFGSNHEQEEEDDDDAEDVAWRAALRAGRYNSSQHTSNTWSQAPTTTVPRPLLRQLEQRMELLSQALLLAPPAHLEQVLKVWQQCEQEMTTLLAQEAEVDLRFNDAADRKLPGTFINDTAAVQPRREIGRGAPEEAPMGLFDVARGAAAALSKSAFPLTSARAPAAAARENLSDSRASADFSDSASMTGSDERVRKRDMVASVASGALNTGTGALASGLGWMLGAKPVHDQDRE